MNNRKLGSIALARQLCYEIAGAASEDDDISGRDYGSVDVAEILSAEVVRLREALAQPKQQAEPVAWMTINAYGEEDDIHYENPEGHLLEGWTYKPLYTHPPTVQPEKEPLEYWNAVEGWVKIAEVREHFGAVGCGTIYKTAGEDRVPLYKDLQKRSWAGLTDDEIKEIVGPYGDVPIKGYTRKLFDQIEAALRSKNT